MTPAPTATHQTSTPRLLASVRLALEIRDSTLEEIRSATPAWLNTTAGADRVRDIDHQNRWIEIVAGRYGMIPADLIAAAMAA